MDLINAYLLAKETQRHLEETHQWAANERLARQTRMDRPTFAERIAMMVRRLWMPPAIANAEHELCREVKRSSS